MTAAIDITAGQRKTLLVLLRRFIPCIAVWAYGSRVKWTARPNSDLDLVAFTTPEQNPLVSELKEALAESNLPFLVDFHVWGEVPERFHEIIRKEYVVVQQAEEKLLVRDVPGKWEETTLGNEVDLLTGFPFKSDRYTDSDESVRLLRGDNIIQGSLRWEGVKRWPAPKSGEYDVYQLRDGDVVLAMDRPWIEAGLKYAAISRYDLPCLLVQRTARLRGNKNLDTRFLRYLIGSREFTQHILAVQTGTAIPHISGSQIKDFAFLKPPLPEQIAIAHILGTLDDKIELNRRMNTTLEVMVRALFQSWFVDFDPVRAKLDGRKYADLDAAIAALFPAHFQDSTLGHIPQGWEVHSLDQIAHFLNGLALQKYPPGDGATLPVIKIAQLRKGDSEGADRCNTGLAPQYIVEDGDVLFSWSGSLEVELWCGGRGALNQHLFKVTSLEFPKWFYYLWTLYHLDEFRLIAADKATTMGHIQRGHLTAAKVLVPPPALLKSMTHVMAPLIDQIIANRAQSRTLATLRDALLPKLLSGEISVVAATSELAAVT